MCSEVTTVAKVPLHFSAGPRKERASTRVFGNSCEEHGGGSDSIDLADAVASISAELMTDPHAIDELLAEDAPPAK